MLHAALVEFATFGLHGASTVDIAERAGISQPYVLRLFGTKKNLFLEAVAMARRMIESAWMQALAGVPEDEPTSARIQALGEAFQTLTNQADVLRLLLQAYSAAADDDVRAACQDAMRDLYRWVRASTGASMSEAQAFFATGMLIMVGVSIGAPALPAEEWARAFLRQDGSGTR